MLSETCVLIVGAGPTGLTAALELARMKVPYRLIDRYVNPPSTSRALAVQSRTLELMQQRGLADEMVNLGNKGYVATIRSDGRLLGHVDLRSIDSRFNYILLLAQSETERILRGGLQAAGGLIESQTELIAVGISEGDASINAVLNKSDGSTEVVKMNYLLACEGAHSLIRHTLGLPFRGASLAYSYALADVHVDGDLPEDQLSIFAPQSGLIAAFPMGGRRFRVIATEKGTITHNAGDPDLAYIQELWSVGSDRPVRFYDLVWSSRFRINSRHVDSLRRGRIFLGGDAAHIHSPAGGQGMNTGIQDMVNLAWKIAAVHHGYMQDSVLDTYDEERMPIIRHLVGTTERATDLLNSSSAAIHSLLNYILPIAFKIHAVQVTGATTISEQAATYRASSLSRPARHTGRIKAGDRFPDVLLDEEQRTSALDLLDPSAFTILAYDEQAVLPLAARLSALPFFRTRVLPGKPSCWDELLGDADVAIVRPDGYLLSSETNAKLAAELEMCIARWFVA